MAPLTFSVVALEAKVIVLLTSLALFVWLFVLVWIEHYCSHIGYKM